MYDTYSFTQKREKKFEIKPHVHDKFEFVYFFSGKGTIKYKNKVFDFAERSYFVMEPNVSHCHFYSEQSNCLIIWFKPDETIKLKSAARTDLQFEISTLCQKIRDELEKKAQNYDKMTNAIANEIIFHLIRAQDKREDENNNFMLKNTIAYIDEYYMTPLRITDLADSCGYAVDHYRVLFKKETGKSPKEYIMDKRQNLAAKLLSETDMTVSEISYHCGFEYESHFSRCFKEKFKVSPLQFRKNPQRET